MANTRDIRNRIKSVKNTAQITKAMELVAASKMKRAQDSAIASRPYALLLAEILGAVGERCHRHRKTQSSHSTGGDAGGTE